MWVLDEIGWSEVSTGQFSVVVKLLLGLTLGAERSLVLVFFRPFLLNPVIDESSCDLSGSALGKLGAGAGGGGGGPPPDLPIAGGGGGGGPEAGGGGGGGGMLGDLT